VGEPEGFQGDILGAGRSWKIRIEGKPGGFWGGKGKKYARGRETSAGKSLTIGLAPHKPTAPGGGAGGGVGRKGKPKKPTMRRTKRTNEKKGTRALRAAPAVKAVLFYWYPGVGQAKRPKDRSRDPALQPSPRRVGNLDRGRLPAPGFPSWICDQRRGRGPRKAGHGGDEAGGGKSPFGSRGSGTR